MRSIRHRLLLTLLVGQIALLVGGGTALFLIVRHQLVHEFDQTLDARAASFILSTEIEDGKFEFELAQGRPREFRVAARGEYFEVWDADSRVLVKSPALGDASLPQAWPDSRHSKITSFRLPDGEHARLLAWRFKPRTSDQSLQTHGDLLLVMARSRSELDRTLDILGSSLLAGVLILPLAVAGLAWWAVGHGLRPLDRMAEQTSRINTTTLAFRFSTEAMPRELRPIAGRFNELLARLGTAFERERRFTSNVAHELRTPIAELSLLADVGVEEAAGSGNVAIFNDVKAITRRMAALTATLLKIARCEAGIERVEISSVDLRDTLSRAFVSQKARLTERRIALRIPAGEPQNVRADPALLAAILDNLASNAAQYTPEGGEIACVIEPRNGAIEVRIGNTNPGCEPEQLAHFFESFWRADNARSDSFHCGLGLHLVKVYARVLGGSIQVNLESPTWLSFNLELRNEPDSARSRESSVEPGLPRQIPLGVS